MQQNVSYVNLSAIVIKLDVCPELRIIADQYSIDHVAAEFSYKSLKVRVHECAYVECAKYDLKKL